jgi:hypothetical protein
VLERERTGYSVVFTVAEKAGQIGTTFTQRTRNTVLGFAL